LSTRGQSTLYAIVLMPVLLLTLALVADIGSLQVERTRLKAAQDMALVDAVTEVDPAHYAATGRLRVDAGAADVYRQYLAANLEAMRDVFGGATPQSVAAEADVIVINAVPAVSPCTGRQLTRPGICARLRAPLRSGLLHLAGLDPVQVMTVAGDAEIRVDRA
jgi:hypothetical protein